MQPLRHEIKSNVWHNCTMAVFADHRDQQCQDERIAHVGIHALHVHFMAIVSSQSLDQPRSDRIELPSHQAPISYRHQLTVARWLMSFDLPLLNGEPAKVSQS
jgi:hypothetical protein